MKKYVVLLVFVTIPAIILAVYLFNNKLINSTTNTTQTKLESPLNEESDTQVTNTFIENLRQREYKSSTITIENTITNNGIYTGYIIFYISDELKIYGRMNVPNGDPPAGGFPVIILNHGYFNQSSFTSGDGTQTMADILARNGYLTLASDYRGFGKSENDEQGSRGHNPNYAIDVLNLIASVGNIDKADPDNIGIWGHSMGGEVSLRTIEATDSVKAVVLWAPTSTNQSANSAFYRGSSSQNEEEAHNDGDLQYINTPISLHQGLSDVEVNPEWSKELNEDLQKLGKQIEYFEYESQDHNFRNLGWDEISKRTIEFFNSYLK